MWMIGTTLFGLILCFGPTGAVKSSAPGGGGLEPINRSLRLSDVGASIGIQALHHSMGMGTGLIAADYDGDGDIDLFVPSGVGFACQLYRNDGGVFVDVAVASGIVDLNNARSALWFDADGDDLLDLVIQFDQFQQPGAIGTRTLALYQQQADHSFMEVTVGSGLDLMPLLAPQTHGGAMCAGDINGDDRLDLVVTTWDEGVWIFRNDGGMTFTDITADSPLDGVASTFWQPVMFDQDVDGDLDVFIAHDFFANPLLDNDGTGAFIDSASALGLDSSFNEMGAALGDCDNDGDLDLYVTNLFGNPGGTAEHNVFFTKSNVGIGYDEESVALGVDNGGWGWGTVFVDYDNDGRLDLAEVNATEFGGADVPWKLWMNRGAMVGTPVYVAEEASIGFGFADYGSALVHADIDRDGDQDFLATVLGGPVRVLESNTTEVRPNNRWLVVRPRMPGTGNTRAIGAVITARTGGVTRTRLISAGTSFMAQIPAEAHFGIGQHTVIDEVIVNWPNGTQTVLTDVAPGQVLDVSPIVQRKGVGLRDRIESKLRKR